LREGLLNQGIGVALIADVQVVEDREVMSRRDGLLGFAFILQARGSHAFGQIIRDTAPECVIETSPAHEISMESHLER
jgi:hypothetical protein